MRILRRSSLMTLAAFVLFAGISYGQEVPENQVRVAAVSYVLEFLQPHDGGPVVACVSVSAVKPSAGAVFMNPAADFDSALIAITPSSRFTVRPGSACYVSGVRPMPRLEKVSDRPAVVIVVGKPEFETEKRAAILVQYLIHGRNGVGFACKVVRRQNAWEVEVCDQTWRA